MDDTGDDYDSTIDAKGETDDGDGPNDWTEASSNRTALTLAPLPASPPQYSNTSATPAAGPNTVTAATSSTASAISQQTAATPLHILQGSFSASARWR
ncbi:hypothetical protein EJ08DRAFT_653792 [Tothia fuscella]|uniref:Uncharacterized protein n=1 Tax=Tothia fuscella TaxID=1048955 RepID=A0A9P4TTT8_9PEZI|nr:hypothetical protein EJ08DRAFT_653792 [Tothia fuscella]